MEKKDDNRAEEQAQAQYESIAEMVKRLNSEDEKIAEAARAEIEEDALSVQVRSDWHTPGDKEAGPTEYEILLCTGGPAVRIIGELGRYNEPETATIQYQDWFTSWTDWRGADEEILLQYVRCFYFGE